MSFIFQRASVFALIAATPIGPALAVEPADIQLGGLTLTPSLRLSESYDDNFRATRDAESSWITTLAPTFVLGAQDRLNTYTLKYGFNHRTFHSSHSDDNTDHHLSANANMEFDSRNRLKLGARYDRVEEEADTTSSLENDKYHVSDINTQYRFGSETALMQLELGAGHEQMRYDNSGTLNADRDHDTDSLTGTFYYRVAPKTRALLEANYDKYSYETAVQSGTGAGYRLDSDSISYLAGLTWDATAATTGTVKIGRQRKDFEAPAFNDPSEPVWELGLTWNPRSYSTFSLTASQEIDEGGKDDENFIKSRRTELAWKHHWRSYISTELGIWRSNEQYANQANREDKTNGASVGVTYDMRRWLSIGLGYQYTDRDSTRADKAYERNLYMATIEASL